MAKIGLDGHDRGVKVVARALRDAGMEIIYTGLHRRPEEVVRIAIDEDVDVIGVSVLSGAHMHIFPRVIELLDAEDAREDITIIGGGTILPEDIDALHEMGIHKVMGVDTPLQDIVDTINEAVATKRAAQ
jgi:methylmalonyl-CoA mutase cobalamin-binding domain/chain